MNNLQIPKVLLAGGSAVLSKLYFFILLYNYYSLFKITLFDYIGSSCINTLHWLFLNYSFIDCILKCTLFE